MPESPEFIWYSFSYDMPPFYTRHVKRWLFWSWWEVREAEHGKLIARFVSFDDAKEYVAWRESCVKEITKDAENERQTATSSA